MKYFAPVLAAVLVPALLPGQIAKSANENYGNEESRSKIAATLTEHGRDSRQRPKELIERLGIKPGMTVADIGTGPGYMLPWLSGAVGSGGSVYAEDIFADFLDKAKTAARGLQNVKFIQGTERDARLPVDSIDLALILDAYHHFNYPEAMLASIRKGLKASGRLAVMEYHRNEKSMAGGNAMKHIRATQSEFVKEIEGYGFRALEVHDFTPDVQWYGIFQRQ